jgi:hypothetical protein
LIKKRYRNAAIPVLLRGFADLAGTGVVEVCFLGLNQEDHR